MSAVMAAFRGPNSELKKLPPYSPFLNIVKEAISALKLAIKADISRPEQQGAIDCASLCKLHYCMSQIRR